MSTLIKEGMSPADILIVDDNPKEIELLTLILGNAGYQVRSAPSGELGLEAAAQSPPELILMDIMMPGMDGFEACRLLKAGKSTRDIPVIILSALMEPDDKARAFAAGAVDYLTKPFQHQEALARIRTHLALSETSRRLRQRNRELTREMSVRRKAEAELERHKNHLEELVAERTRDLTRAKEKYRAIFTEARDGIVLATPSTGFIVEANPEFERQTGRELQALGYLHFWELPTRKEAKDARKAFQDIVRDGEGSREMALIRPDGTTLYVEYTAKVIALAGHEFVQFVVRDITERKKLEEELAKSHHYITNIFDSMPSQIIGVDAEGKLTHWNMAAKESMGRSFEDVEGKALKDVIPRFSGYLENIRLAIKERRPVSIEREPCWDNGQLCYQNIMFYPLVADGIEGVVIRVDNVTEHVRISNILIQSEKMASVGGLAAGMAHEINNPLGSILQSAQVLQNRLLTDLPANAEAARECGASMEALRCYMDKRHCDQFLESIRESGARAADIVRSMLDFSRKSESTRVLSDVNEIIEKSLELASTDYDLKKKYDFRHIAIAKNFAPSLPSVPCIRSEIEQVLLNLLKNAAQALGDKPAGEREPAITLSTSLIGDRVRITVEDNGPGIPDVVRKRIFDPFFTTKKPGEGTGLGLSVSYYIITNNHDGSLGVESEPGQWTRFSIELPLSPPD